MNITDLLNPYAAAMMLRRYFYRRGFLRSERVSVPVISVGNLSMGGTGKTPATLFLAGYCIDNLHKRTAVVLRGYKRKTSGYLLVGNGKEILESAARSGDEAQLYTQELPKAIVICDEDRIRGAKNAIALGAEIILLDDGFQHLRLQRDLNILLINSDEGIPPVLPFGRGREPVSAARDADIVMLTNSDKRSPSFIGLKPEVVSQTGIEYVRLYGSHEVREVPPEIFHDNRILSLSGIANPERFDRLLAAFAKDIVPYRLPDHSEYDNATLQKIVMRAREEKCSVIATTTKDAVKMLVSYTALQQTDSRLPPLAVVHTNIEIIEGEEILLGRMNNLFKTHS